MIFCNGCVEDGKSAAACDFCKHYSFNGDDQGRYTGDGYCNLNQESSDPGSFCEDFHCFRAESDPVK
jgi:hypothetical protein